MNSEFTKLISLVVKDVRINKDISTKKNGKINTVKEAMTPERIMDFRNKKVPSFITSFAQANIFSLYLSKINLWFF